MRRLIIAVVGWVAVSTSLYLWTLATPPVSIMATGGTGDMAITDIELSDLVPPPRDFSRETYSSPVPIGADCLAGFAHFITTAGTTLCQPITTATSSSNIIWSIK